MNLFTRRLALALALAVILTAVVPVTAKAADTSGWIELLESSSIQSNGENWFTITGTSGTVTIPVYREMRLRKIDMLLWNPTGQRPTAASVTVNGSTTNLDVLQIGSNLCRVVGYVPNTWYDSVSVSLTKSSSTSATYEVLSCKVTPLGVQEFTASGTVYLDGVHYPFSQLITAEPRSGGTQYGQIVVLVNDWRKYDRISIWGSAEDFIFTSFRPSISTSGLPYELSYLAATPTGEWVEVYSDATGYYWPGESQGEYEGHENTEGYTQITTDGKYLFCLTIDLSSCDRSITDALNLYITGLFMGQVGYTFNCQYVNGQVDTADTTNVSWWQRFTSFFTGLFGGDSDKADDFETDMEQQGQVVEDAADQIDDVARPDLDDVDVDISQFIDADGSQQVADIMGQLFSIDLVVTMVMISLMVALAAFVIFGKR